MANTVKQLNEELKSQEPAFGGVVRQKQFEYDIVLNDVAHKIYFKGKVADLSNEINELGLEGTVKKYNNKPQVGRPTEKMEVTAEYADSPQPEDDVDIIEQFKTVEAFVDMICAKKVNSVIVSGATGTGKSTEVYKRLEDNGLVKNRDYVVKKGYSTSAAFFNMLYENNGKVIVLDDFDEIWDKQTSLNMLKNALETRKLDNGEFAPREIAWGSTSSMNVPVQEFEFTGRIIFISNKDFFKQGANSKHVAAVVRRALFVQITNSADQLYRRIEQLAPVLERDKEIREKVLEYILEHKSNRISISLFEQLCDLYRFDAERFELMAKTSLQAIKLA